MSKKKNKWMTPSEFGFRLNLANHTARDETERLENVWNVQTPPVNLRQALRMAKDSVVKALGK